MTLFFLENRLANGIFNVGTGKARTWNDVAGAMFNALDLPAHIEYIPMPEDLKEKYQYYTCADMQKLRAAGCTHECRSLEEAVEEYLGTYLASDGFLDPSIPS
jgi:ADP-L-glycero-D-manno-heptose 6-epimerase